MDYSLLIVAIVWAAFSLLTRNAKKKNAANTKQQGGQAQAGPQSRQQQAIEEQRRRRAAYEAAKRQQEKQDYDRQTQRMFGTAEDIEKREAAAEIREPHHIDEEEERRCAEAAAKKEKERKLRVSEQELKRELLQRYGSLEERQSQKPRPQTLEQAQQQLYMPVNAPPQREAAPRPRIADAGGYTWQASYGNNMGMSSHNNALVQGIIMAEILGPPRSKKKKTAPF